MTELLSDSHFWIGVAFAIFLAMLFITGVPKMITGMLDAKAAQGQAQLDEARVLREEAEGLLAQIKTQREQSEQLASEIMANAKEEAKRLQTEAQAKLAEQIERRGQLAERRIATAEAQASAEVKAAAAEVAAQAAETILTARAAGAKSDPMLDAAIAQIGTRLN